MPRAIALQHGRAISSIAADSISNVGSFWYWYIWLGIFNDVYTICSSIACCLLILVYKFGYIHKNYILIENNKLSLQFIKKNGLNKNLYFQSNLSLVKKSIKTRWLPTWKI